VANHHAGADALSPTLLAASRPSVVVVPGWAPIHPSGEAIDRVIRTTDALIVGTTSGAVGEPWQERYSAPQGHVVVRVEPGGARYRVIVTTDEDESDRVLAVFGPLDATSRSSSSP